MSPSRPDLFRVDPNDFVARRTELVRELRARGEKDEAAEVKALRRPTVPVWALNQVANEHPDLVQHMATAAETARAAQQALLEGSAADDFRDALARRREAMSAVSDAADKVVERSSRSRGTYTRDIENMLNAVVASAELTDALARGELDDGSSGADGSEEMFAGLTPTTGRPARTSEPAPARPPKTTTPPSTTPTPRLPSARLVKAREKLEEQRGELQAAEQAVNAADRRVVATESDVAKATRELDRATGQRDQAREHLDRLRGRVEHSEQLVHRLDP
ncbi:MAG: hypothetical protein JWM72_4708 [Actinomycetia bacterium]|nr:hypothetical protein [Actinomycetes bacterium]